MRALSSTRQLFLTALLISPLVLIGCRGGQNETPAEAAAPDSVIHLPAASMAGGTSAISCAVAALEMISEFFTN